MARVGELLKPRRAVLAVEVRGGEVEAARLVALQVERQQEGVVGVVELRERLALLRQIREEDVAVGHRAPALRRAGVAVEGREGRARRHAHRAPAPEEVAFWIDEPPFAVNFFRVEAACRRLLRPLRPAAEAVAVVRTGMRGEVGLLGGHGGLQLRIAVGLSGPVAPLELPELVEARQEVLRRHLRPRLVRDGHLDGELLPDPAPHLLVGAIERIDDLGGLHFGPFRAARNLIVGREQNGRIPKREALHNRLLARAHNIRRGETADLAREQVDPDGIPEPEHVKDHVAALVRERVARTLSREPQHVDGLRLPLELRNRQFLPVHGLLREADGVDVLVEVGEDVLHRVEARATVDDLLEEIAAQEAEALEHERVLQVDAREDARRDVARRVADRAAQVPLRLGVLRPLDAVDRVGVFELRRAAHLALEDVEAGRIALHERTQRLREIRVRSVGVVLVGVVDEEAREVEGVLLLQALQQHAVVALDGRLPLLPRPADRRHVALRVRLHGADGLRGAVEELGVLGTLVEGLVPDLPFVHHVLVAFHARGAVAQPRRKRLGVPRDLLHAHAEAEVATPHGVAVGEADPGLHAHRRHLAHLRVEPGEVVDALLLLRLRPAAEEAAALRAEIGQVVLVGVPVGVVAVHRLAADRPLGALDVARKTRLKHAGGLEPALELADLLPGDGGLLLLKDRLGSLLLEMVIPGVPALDLRGVLEGNDAGGRRSRTENRR